MTIILIIKTIFNFILFFILEKTQSCLIISSGFLLLYIFYVLLKEKNVLTIETFRFNWIDCLFFLIFYICVYLTFFLVLRFRQWGYMLDVKNIFNKLNHFCYTNETSYIVFTIVFCLLFITTILILFAKLRFIIKKNLMKIHFFIINKYPMLMFNETPYDKFRYKFYTWHDRFSLCFYNLYSFVSKNFIIHIKKEKLDHSKISKIEVLLIKYCKFNALFILVLLIIYDLIFNNFILTKFYFFIPFVFIYNMIFMFFNILTLMEKTNECIVACVLYYKIIGTDENLIYFDNNVSFDLLDYNISLIEINSLINNNL